MNKRDTKFVARIIVLATTSLALSIGARIVLQSDELTKLVPRTPLREFMILFAPLVSLMALHYTLAVKSFGMRSLKTEGMVYAFCASLFLAITLAYFFGKSVEVHLNDCPWWKLRGCNGSMMHKDNYFWSAVITLAGFGALFLALTREKILEPRSWPSSKRPL